MSETQIKAALKQQGKFDFIKSDFLTCPPDHLWYKAPDIRQLDNCAVSVGYMAGFLGVSSCKKIFHASGVAWGKAIALD